MYMEEQSSPPYDLEFYRSLLELSPQALVMFDQNDKCIFLSPAFSRLVRGGGDHFLQGSALVFFQDIHPEDESYFRNSYEMVKKGGKEASLSVLFRFLTHQGSYRLVEAFLVNSQGKMGVQGIIVYINGVVDRKQAEDMILSEREKLFVTLRSIGDGVITTDLDGRVTLMNKVAENLTGWDQWEASGRPLREVFDLRVRATGQPADLPVAEVLRTGRTLALPGDVQLFARGGSRYLVQDSAAPIRNKNSEIIGAVLVFRDVTQDKINEEESLKVQKLEAVGLLAGGIAHDFNNILTAVMGNVSLALVQLDPGSEVVPLLDQVQLAVRRAGDLTNQLLTFSKGGSPVLEPTSLPHIIFESARFILHGSRVGCQFQVAPDLFHAQVDKGQISQVIQNLVLNGLQAMPGGGTIRIKAWNARIREEEGLPLEPGPYVCIEVKDEGIGIAPENHHKIFEPYFTTKPTGNGLGLPIVYSIMKSHHGLIRLESEPGKGASFILYLPATNHTGTMPSAGAEAQPRKFTGRCLIMDDEDQARMVLQQMLRYLGLESEACGTGEEALELYGQSMRENRKFDLAILDLTIPSGMGGKEAVTKLRELDPGARVIVASGYSSDPIMSQYRLFGFDAGLAKPYDLKELARALTQAME